MNEHNISTRKQVYDANSSSLGLFQIERVEAFSEPAVDRSEQIAA